MKRIVFFFVILVVFFAIAFSLSLLLSPEWLTISNWVFKLSITIVIVGIGIIGSGILSQILSFLFEDKEFKERLSFIVGDKYKKISKKLDEFTQLEIGKEKKSRKYIPNIFVETTEIKEKLRYFFRTFYLFSQGSRANRTEFTGILYR